MRCRVVFFLLVSSFLSLVSTQGTGIWVIPDGKLPDLSQTFTAGSTLPLSWTAWTSSSIIDATDTFVDLWVTAFDTAVNPFSQLILGNINLTAAGQFSWTIGIPNSNLTIDPKYVLRFKPAASIYDPNSAYLASPGILVLRDTTDTTPPSSTSSTPVTSSLPSSSTPSQTTSTESSCTSCGLSPGATAGIGIGAGLIVLAIGIGVFCCIVRRQKKGSAALASREIEGKETGEYKYDVYPRAPVEMNSVGTIAELPPRF